MLLGCTGDRHEERGISGGRYSRRDVVAGATAAAVVAGLPQTIRASSARRPNIVFILADDLGYADLSCYGRRDYRTPRLDRIAADGLLMSHAYSSSAVCSPTRVALITGRYPGRLRAGLEEPIARPNVEVGLPPTHPTLPALLGMSGYRTALVGKWHMGWPPNFGPLRSGYDRFFGILPGAVDYFSHGGDGVAAPADTSLMEGEAPISRAGYLTDLFADRACVELREAAAAGQPLFLSLHFTAPHWPWQGPGDSEVDFDLRDLFHRDGGTLEKYGEMVVALDSAVGRVVDQIAALGLEEDTILIFTSDNGGERFSDNWPFRGEKTDLLEGGIRVPQLVRWAGKIAPGSRSTQVMASMDWLPTLAAAAGASPDPSSPPDGEDLLAVLIGTEPARDRTIFWRFKNRDQAAVRSGKWKYLRQSSQESLFDLATDPRERANLKDRHPEIFAGLRDRYELWKSQMLPYPEGSVSAGPG